MTGSLELNVIGCIFVLLVEIGVLRGDLITRLSCQLPLVTLRVTD